MPRQITIGDIHGCLHALDTVLDAIRLQIDDTLIVLGDVIDQGHESNAVIQRLLQLRSECRLVCIKGNHEELMLDAIRSENMLRYWELAGGVNTLNSYRFGGSPSDIPREHIEFLRGFRDYYETPRHIFTHASYDPLLPMHRQPVHKLRWEMIQPDSAQPHFSGKTVFLGHTEQIGGEVLDLGFLRCLDTACWRYGWLTAMDVDSNQTWQASRFGHLRVRDEHPVGPITPSQA